MALPATYMWPQTTAPVVLTGHASVPTERALLKSNRLSVGPCGALREAEKETTHEIETVD